MLTAVITRVLTLAGRHTLRVWLLWCCAVLVLVAMPVSLVDPPVLMLLLDPELLALIVLSLCGQAARWRVPRASRGRRGTSQEPV
jgi:4-amino-4-deoxy-L-arabinose transferase-like glycosyltransferase